MNLNMKYTFILFWLVGIFGSALAGPPYQNLTQILSSAPLCSLHCSTPAISGLVCLPRTTEELAECICPDMGARRRIAICVKKSCGYKDVAKTSSTSKNYCAAYPVPSKTWDVKRAAIILLLVTVPFVACRAWSRVAIMKSLWWDDYTLALSSAMLFASLITYVSFADRGLGLHVWDVDPVNYSILSKYFLFSQLSYAFVQIITKISILLCFLRIFPQRWFRYVIYGTIAFITTVGIAFVLLLALRCIPFDVSWDQAVKGNCLSMTIITYAGTAVSIFEDFWIIALPLPMLKTLKITRGRKAILIAMFSVGSLACITSMIRLKYVKNFGDDTDSTWDNVDITIWSIVENSVSVICACLPALKPLLCRLLPKMFGTITSNTQSAYGTNKSRLSSLGSTGERRSHVQVKEELHISTTMASDMRGCGQRAESRGESEVYVMEGENRSTCTLDLASRESYAEENDGIRMEKVASVEVSSAVMFHKKFNH